jgi:hypothetical protein
MIKTMLLASTAAAAVALMTVPFGAASAQGIEVQINPPIVVTPAPTYVPRQGAWGDRDRDGIPNIADNYNNNRTPRGGAYGDRDRDGIPNAYDRDRDGDGVPNRWDSNPNNAWRN